MAKKETQETPAPGSAAEIKAPDALSALQAEVTANEQAVRLTEEALEKRRQAVLEARAKFELEYAAKVAAKEKEEAHKRQIPVIVQRRRNAPLKFRAAGKMLTIESMKMTLVSKKELRVLQGYRNRGVIDLLIGPVEKDGKVVEKLPVPFKG